jgi:hypothetical protein
MLFKPLNEKSTGNIGDTVLVLSFFLCISFKMGVLSRIAALKLKISSSLSDNETSEYYADLLNSEFSKQGDSADIGAEVEISFRECLSDALELSVTANKDVRV